MSNLTALQNEFFETLKSIQESAVYQALGQYRDNDSLEDLLYRATFEAITSICEVIDGYTNDKLHLDLVDMNSPVSLKSGIQMHDRCADYLSYETKK